MPSFSTFNRILLLGERRVSYSPLSFLLFLTFLLVHNDQFPIKSFLFFLLFHRRRAYIQNPIISRFFYTFVGVALLAFSHVSQTHSLYLSLPVAESSTYTVFYCILGKFSRSLFVDNVLYIHKSNISKREKITAGRLR